MDRLRHVVECVELPMDKKKTVTALVCWCCYNREVIEEHSAEAEELCLSMLWCLNMTSTKSELWSCFFHTATLSWILNMYAFQHYTYLECDAIFETSFFPSWILFIHDWCLRLSNYKFLDDRLKRSFPTKACLWYIAYHSRTEMYGTYFTQTSTTQTISYSQIA